MQATPAEAAHILALLRAGQSEAAQAAAATRWGIDWSEQDLSGLSLTGMNLHKANLSGADLEAADLSHTDLRGADLRGAWLRDARLDDTDLRGADLRGADLKRIGHHGLRLTGCVWDMETVWPRHLIPPASATPT